MVYTKEIHLFAPLPPFFIYIFSQNEIYFIKGERGEGEKLAFFCNFWSIGEKLCILFTNWGTNTHFPLFYILFQSFFPPKMLFGHIFAQWGGGVKTEKYTPWLIMFPFFYLPRKDKLDNLL